MLVRFPRMLNELLRGRGVLGPADSPRIARLASIRGVSRGSSGMIVSVWPLGKGWFDMGNDDRDDDEC